MNSRGTPPPLSVQGLQLADGEGEVAFDVRQGEVLALVGENGSGKSLLLSCLAGHRFSPGARVRVFGHDMFRKTERPAAQALTGVMFQQTGLIRSLSVFENVALPLLTHGLELSSELEDRVMLRLNMVGCGHLAQRPVGDLSEGDRRCIALARALSGDTRLLLADEPIGFLSPRRSLMIEELLATLVESEVLCAAVIATQDIDFAARLADHFLVMQSARPGNEPVLCDLAGAGGVPFLRDSLRKLERTAPSMP